jgi:hypothetical protein
MKPLLLVSLVACALFVSAWLVHGLVSHGGVAEAESGAANVRGTDAPDPEAAGGIFHEPDGVEAPSCSPAQPGVGSDPRQLLDLYAKLPLSFIENKGQLDEHVRFQACGPQGTAFFTPREVVFVLVAQRPGASDVRPGPDRASPRSAEAASAAERQSYRALALRVSFVGANPDAVVAGRGELPGKVNVFKGSDPSKWRTSIPTFREVTYRDLWPGIDLVYRGRPGGGLKYDLIVHPGADRTAIRLRYEGCERLSVSSTGELVIQTALGPIAERAPLVYQEVRGERVELAGAFELVASDTVAFQVPAHDSTCPLIIDPVVAFSYSTYLGGPDTDLGFRIALDASGSIYVTGCTCSDGFPTTAGAYDTTYNGGERDVFVAKLDAAGNGSADLVYSTFLGGTGEEYGHGIAVDGSGSAYVSGYTDSPDFPTTPGAFDTTANGDRDAYVTKLDPSGTVLLYSTVIGGTAEDVGYGIAVDDSGNAYITGYTSSTVASGFPVTAGAYDGSHNGESDAFVIKLDPAGNGAADLVYSTLLGGTGRDDAHDTALDTSGNAYVTGETFSEDFPTTEGAYQRTFGGSRDVFVAKLNLGANGQSDLVYSTYLGGSGTEFCNSIAVDSSASACVIGITNSGDFPVTPGAYDGTRDDPDDAFVTKIDPAGNGTADLVYSTFLGAEGGDYAYGIAVDWSDRLWIMGETTSVGFPVTTDAYDSALDGARDAFVARLDPAGNGPADLLYSTFLGGTVSDYGRDIAVDPSGDVVVLGYTWSSDYPTTAGAYDRTSNGEEDVFIAKFSSPLPFSTYLGGSNDDSGLAIAVDPSGNAYIAGETVSPDFPTTAGAYDIAYDDLGDAFVLKLNATGSGLIYSTFLGGSDSDSGDGIAVDVMGNAYVAGSTKSSDFPATVDAYNTSHNGGVDAFAAKLGPSGDTLVYSTFLGGTTNDYVRGGGIAVDTSGNAYVAGHTDSPDFPTTAGAYDTSFNGYVDGFVAKLNADGSDLLYSTFLGGSLAFDYCSGMTIDGSGNAWVAGYTDSADFPTTLGAYDESYNGGFDALVVELDPAGNGVADLVYSSFLGGSVSDAAWSVDVDASGDVYVTGDTESADFPTTSGAYDESHNGDEDVFVTKLHPAGSGAADLVYSTFLGGGLSDYTQSLAIDAAGSAYVTGATSSADFPTTSGAFDESHNGGEDVFVTKLSASGSALLYSTLLGGAGDECGRGIALNVSGSAYVTGRTDSSSFPTTLGAFDEFHNGGRDAFAAKLDPLPDDITDVYWNQDTTSVVITFASVAEVLYTLEAADADAYADGLAWSDLSSVTAGAPKTTVTDELSLNPLTADFRFYRVKRADGSAVSRQTAAVFELELDVGFAQRFFIASTPLTPDPDHATVADVLGAQLNYANVKLDKLTAHTGLYTRATYAPGAGWTNSFVIVPGESYMLNAGDALPFPHAVRLTGYVPEQALTVSVTRASFAVTQRWMAYGMPGPTTLGALGLEAAVTPFWSATSEVRLMPLGATIWNRYFWDGANWRQGSLVGPLADDTPIACGEGIVFIHNGIPAQPDTLTWPTWYLHPPNAW